MRARLARRAALGVVAGLVAAFAVALLGPVAAAVSPSGETAASKQYGEKVTICHRTGSKKKRFHTIRVSRNALKAHLRHGDVVGDCRTAVFAMCHKTKRGKHTMKVKGSKRAQRHLRHGDKLGRCKGKRSGKPGKDREKGKGSDKDKGKGKDKGKKKGK